MLCRPVKSYNSEGIQYNTIMCIASILLSQLMLCLQKDYSSYSTLSSKQDNFLNPPKSSTITRIYVLGDLILSHLSTHTLAL